MESEAKSEIIKNIKAGGKIILNRDDKYFSFLRKSYKKKFKDFIHLA